MNEDHFLHVTNHFDLIQYHVSNDIWYIEYLSCDTNDLVISERSVAESNRYEISFNSGSSTNPKRPLLYINLPKSVAVEVVNYIKETEMLFV